MSARRALQGAGWFALVAVIDLIARAFAYALATPTGARAQLEGDFGGPRMIVLSLVVVGGALALSAAVLALAEMGVRERWALEDDRSRGPRPRISLRAFAAQAVGIWVSGLVLFTLVESYIHWRAGLGFHGISCLVGPVHRNVIPIIGGLSLIGSAAVAGLAHLLAWMQRVVERVLGRRRRVRARRRVSAPRARALLVPAAPVLAALRARPPPRSPSTC